MQMRDGETRTVAPQDTLILSLPATHLGDASYLYMKLCYIQSNQWQQMPIKGGLGKKTETQRKKQQLPYGLDT